MAQSKISIIIEAIDKSTKVLKDSSNKISWRAKQNEARFQKMATFWTAAFVGIGAGILKVTDDASNLVEINQKFWVVYSKMADQASKTASELASWYWLAKSSARWYLADIWDLVSWLWFTQDASLEFGQTVVSLGTDLASFSNVAWWSEEAIDRLKKWLLGEHENLKALWVQIDQTMLKEKLLAMGKADLTWLSLKQAQVEARLQLVMEQSKNAIWDFARSKDSLANQTRIAQARIQDLRDTLGQWFYPIVLKIVEAISPMIERLTTRASENQELATKIWIAALAIAGITAVIWILWLALPAIITWFGFVATAIAALTWPIWLAVAAIWLIGGALISFTWWLSDSDAQVSESVWRISNLRTEITNLTEEMKPAQTEVDKFTELEAELTEQFRNWYIELDEYKTRMADLTDEYQPAMDALDWYKIKISESTELNEKASKKYASLEKRMFALKDAYLAGMVTEESYTKQKDKLMDKMKLVEDWNEDYINSIWWISYAFKELTKDVKVERDKQMKIADETIDDIKESVKNWSERFSKFMGDGMDTMTNWVSTKRWDIKWWFFKSIKDIWTTVASGIWNVVNFIRDWMNQAQVVVSGIWEQIKWTFLSYWTQAKDRAGNMIWMFVQGIKNGAAAVKDAAAAVTTGIKKVLWFWSPTEEWDGKNSDEWMPNLIKMLADWLKDWESAVKHAASKIAGAIKEWVEDNMEDLEAIVSELRINVISAFESITSKLNWQESEVLSLADEYRDLQDQLKNLWEEGQKEIQSITDKIVEMQAKIAGIEDEWTKSIAERAVAIRKELEEISLDLDVWWGDTSDIEKEAKKVAEQLAVVNKRIADEKNKDLEWDAKQAQILKDSLEKLQDQLKAENEKNALLERQSKLLDELAIAEKNTTSDEIVQAKIESEKTVTEKIIDRMRTRKEEAEQDLYELQRIKTQKIADYEAEKNRILVLRQEKKEQIKEEFIEFYNLQKKKEEVETKYFQVFAENISYQQTQQEKTISLLDQHISRMNTLIAQQREEIRLQEITQRNKEAQETTWSRAVGGTVLAWKSYRVWELWPETFTPLVNGTIEKNWWGGAMTVNTTISGVSINNGMDLSDFKRQVEDVFVNAVKKYNLWYT